MKPKLIIFDLDGTLYDLKDVHEANYAMQVQFVQQQMGLSEAESIQLLNDNGVYSIITNKSKSATELFARLGFDMGAWKQYREIHFDAFVIDKSKAVAEDVVRGFAEICPLVLLSSNALRNILKTLDYLGINAKLFDTIYCSDNAPTSVPFNKKQIMQIIADKYHVKCSDIISIGDRYLTDVVPMLEIDGHGIVINQPFALKRLLYDLENGVIEQNEEFTYY